VVIGITIDFFAKLLELRSEGQWIVIIFALIILCSGISKLLHIDELLACMAMGVTVVNKCNQEKLILRILERYTEDLIFLLFFLLSGLHLDITTIPPAIALIVLFVFLRTIGKYAGANSGARIAKAGQSIQKYTAGGLLSQGGIVIGLVLSIYQYEELNEISGILLSTIMGATIVHELIGPIAAKYSLIKSGEIKNTGHNKT
jgi:Kef-type K+ transport system membrane component KefB